MTYVTSTVIVLVNNTPTRATKIIIIIYHYLGYENYWATSF